MKILDIPQSGKFLNFVITNTGGDIDLKLAVRGTPVPYTIVLGTAPCSAGIS